jgi:hypothetical protein
MRPPLLPRLEQIKGLSEELRFRVIMNVFGWVRDCEEEPASTETLADGLTNEIRKTYGVQKRKPKAKVDA